MYAPNDFEPPKPPERSPRPDQSDQSARTMRPERVTGLIVLLVFVALCLFMSMSLDQDIFNPLNTVIPMTETYRARQTGTPRPPRATQRRDDNNRQVRLGEEPTATAAPSQ